MEAFMRAMMDKSLTPNRVQHLVVSDSKHLYFNEKDEVVRYQKKDLDPRTCGSRKMLTRLITIDEDTGVFYGEIWPRDGDLDLVGFLARSWARKKNHPMRGFPSVIHAPSRVLGDKELSKQLSWLAAVAGATVLPAASGFGPSTIAAREYERNLEYAGAGSESFVIRMAHMAAQEISVMSCSNAVAAFEEHWKSVAGPSAAALHKMDTIYVDQPWWRLDDFESFIIADGT